MKIEIDQSGKLERTSIPTAVGISNGLSVTLFISSTEKKVIQRHFRNIKKPKLFSILTFSVLITLGLALLKKKKFSEIVIDREYPGYENIVCEQVKFFCSLRGIEIENIYVKEVGRKSNSHWAALGAYRDKKQATEMKAKDIIEELKNKKPRSA
ncbi:MAG: hypothetical protein AAB774_00790 [Patescibacteria group bacterium]